MQWVGVWRVRCWLTGVMMAALMVATVVPRPAAADGAWLDNPALTWNTPNMTMPHPTQNRPGPATEVDTRCTQQARPAETDEDRAVERAGWTLFASYEGGWGVRIVRGLSGYDGMCRPAEYQAFVFVDGKLAGTLSPTSMLSRTDGALSEIDFYGGDTVMGQYARYAEQDPLCCPSARSYVRYRIDRSGPAPTLICEDTSTEKTATGG